MCSTYTQGDMNSAVSPNENTMADDSKSLLLVLTPHLDLELGAFKFGYCLEKSLKYTYIARVKFEVHPYMKGFALFSEAAINVSIIVSVCHSHEIARKMYVDTYDNCS